MLNCVGHLPYFYANNCIRLKNKLILWHKLLLIKNKIVMKKVLLFAIILGGAVAFTSCSKDEECVDSDGNKIETTSLPGFSAEEECTLVGGTLK